MKKLTVSASLLAAALAAPVVAEPVKHLPAASTGHELPVRIVVKQKDTPMAQAQGLTTYGQVVGNGGGYTRMEVPAAEAQSILSQLNLRPDVETAELDYVVRVPEPMKASAAPSMMEGHQMSASSSAFPPNDTYFGSQYYWEPQSESAGQSSILDARGISTQNKKMVVAVLDGGFVNATDMDYAGGYNFSTIGTGRDGNYLKDSSGCSNLHGTAVGGIIGATTDNSNGMAGIVDVDLYAGRVLSCASGYLSDAADGIRWAAKDPNVSGTPLPRPADVINLSLSGKTGSCPSYMQDAINYAVSKGSVVVVAAGNDNEDASAYSPANCNNVITVGANSQSGYKASFSNFGSAVDVGAMGMSVLTLQGADDVSFWSGTSFSSPITAGVITLMKQNYPDVSPAQVESMLKSTAGNYTIPYGNMGSGVVNAQRLMNKAHDMFGTRSATVSHAMKADERCQDGFFEQVFSGNAETKTKVCKLFEVDTSSFYGAEGKSYVVFSVPEGESLTASNPNAVVRATGTDLKLLLPDVDVSQFEYGLQVCNANGSDCNEDALYDLRVADAVVPAFCEN